MKAAKHIANIVWHKKIETKKKIEKEQYTVLIYMHLALFYRGKGNIQQGA